MAEFGEPLSQRELDVLHCLAEGATNKEIAQRLIISPNTVKVHLRNAFVKLGASSRTEAITLALQRGLLEGVLTWPLPSTPDEPLEEEESAPEPPTPRPPSTINPSPTSVVSVGRPPRLALLGVLLLLLVVMTLLYYSWQLLRAAPPPLTPTPVATPLDDTPLEADRRWARTQPLPEPRSGMTVVSHGLELYVIGGETDGGLDGVVHSFNVRQRTWRTAAPKPTPVTEAGGAVLGGQIYIVGGRLADNTITPIVEAYSPVNDAWRSVAPLPEPAAGGVVLADEDHLYVFGGWNGQTYLDSAFVYEPTADSWRPLPPLPGPRAYAAGGNLADGLLVVGGFDGRSDLDACLRLETAAERWQACPALLQPRSRATATVILNKLYVLGGGRPATHPYAEVYDPTLQTWQVLSLPMLGDAQVWMDLGATTIETHLYVLGGRLGEQRTADHYNFSPLFYQYIPAAPGLGDN